MEKLKLQRQTIKSNLTRIYNACTNDNLPAEEIKVRVERAEQLFGKFESIQQEIEYLAEDTEQAQEDAYRADIEDKYFAIKSLCLRTMEEATRNRTGEGNQQSTNDISTAVQTLIEHQGSMSALIERIGRGSCLQNSSSPLPATNAGAQQHEIRLPRIQIPEFDGSCTNWIRFHDLFETLVHNKTTISDIEKFEYLQTKLTGDALSLIKHLKPTSVNYSVAWDLLKQKYDKSDRVKRAYFELLFDQQPMKSCVVSEAKRIYNTTNESINALKVLDEPVHNWDSVLLFHLEKKLDADSLVLWFREKRSDKTSTFKEFLNFLERRVFELENIQMRTTNSKRITGIFASTLASCPVCSRQHALYVCEQFKEMAVEERRKLVQKCNLCFNCLQPNHRALSCKRSSCRECNGKHNTLLHLSTAEGTQQLAPIREEDSMSVNSSQQISSSITLLPTAMVMVYDASNNLQPCRVLLDSGSQGTLISEACAQRLQLKRFVDKTLLYGVSSTKANTTRGKVHIRISTRQNKLINTDALCLTNLTQDLPALEVVHEKLRYFENIEFADRYYSSPGKIDIILGADVFSDCILPEKLTHPSGSPSAIKTVFGWVMLGRITAPKENRIIVGHTLIDLSNQIQRFWELEDLPTSVVLLTPEEQLAEDHFKQNVRRESSGRYIVRLPLKNPDKIFGESRTAALKRLSTMERRFSKDENLKNEYEKFMNEYLELGHMKPSTNENVYNEYFLPHHSVSKPTSTTTKLRVVFDASCKTADGTSLNDNLLVGPTIQRDLFEIIINFRKYGIAFCADIEKMYRQILVHPDDHCLQRIFWKNQMGQIIEYDLQTITYGTSAAPFLAIRTLHQIACDNQQEYPNATTAIVNNFYVDDFMACESSLDMANQIKNELVSVLAHAGLRLRKWASNSNAFMNSIDVQDREISSETIIDTTQTVKTLGLLWEPISDTFKYSVSLSSNTDVITKRTVLSDIARVFDPIGWLSPVVVSMKVFMQKLWLRGIEWDEELPKNLCYEWKEYQKNMNTILQLRIPRWLGFNNEKRIEFHGFSDSSELAYAAAIYLRVEGEDGIVRANLVAAKTKVAPVKQITLPRLELCAAHLMTKLMTKVRTSLGFADIPVYGWTDSLIVLAWLSDHPRRWKTFIANRTAQIIGIIPAEQWHHVQSSQNPADLATRGVCPKDIINNTLWWNGPHFLTQQNINYESNPLIHTGAELEEKREISSYNVTCTEIDIIERYSTFTHLVRVTALLLRFPQRCKAKRLAHPSATQFLTTYELLRAHNVLVRKAQASSYPSEIRILQQNKSLPTSHKLASLAPFIDNQGLLRVGGRIENANVPYEQKHPLILSKDHHLTKLIVRHYHTKHLHAGNRQLLYLLSLRYWVQGCTYVVKQCVFKCVTCMRYRGITYKQQMGSIPHHRLDPGYAFINTGVDFAGPLQVRSWKGRGSRLYKCWIALFVCLVTKAIHIELVTDLSAAAFIASLRRFVARRGKPIHMYSDNGTNFVGANQQLCEIYQLLNESSTQDSLSRELSEQHIQWHFSPPSGPHFGGIWEAGVKSVKYHLKRVLADSRVTYEEALTVLCQIEGCLNSRPLCIKFEGDIDPLTPAHFLLLRSSSILPDENLLNLKENAFNRWQYLQRLVQQFWKKWAREYITQLQNRPKWTQRVNNIQIDDVVIIKDDSLPPSQWSIGRVKQIHPGSDGLVRVVTLETSRGTLKRPIVKLCPLFLDI